MANSAAGQPASMPEPTDGRVGKADLHIHTAQGDGLDRVETVIDWVVQHTDLDLIAITDHDDITAGLVGREYAARRGYQVQVVPGVEITTRGGHLLALDVDQPFRMLRPLEESVDEVLAAGGICIAPHPYSWLTTSIGERGLQRLIPTPDTSRLAALEVWNPSLAGMVCHERTKVANLKQWQLAEVGGSDAHAATFVGSAFTTFPGQTWDDFKVALAARTTRAYGRFWTKEEVRPIAIRQTARAWFVSPVVKVRRAMAGKQRELAAAQDQQ